MGVSVGLERQSCATAGQDGVGMWALLLPLVIHAVIHSVTRDFTRRGNNSPLVGCCGESYCIHVAGTQHA